MAVAAAGGGGRQKRGRDEQGGSEGSKASRVQGLTSASLAVAATDSASSSSLTSSSSSSLEGGGRTLFAENLPSEVTEESLEAVFEQCQGFLEARIPPGRNCAFFEFEDSIQAGLAMKTLNGFQLNATHKLQLSYSA
jgi:RNA recognition motif-containing protein